MNRKSPSGRSYIPDIWDSRGLRYEKLSISAPSHWGHCGHSIVASVASMRRLRILKHSKRKSSLPCVSNFARFRKLRESRSRGISAPWRCGWGFFDRRWRLCSNLEIANIVDIWPSWFCFISSRKLSDRVSFVDRTLKTTRNSVCHHSIVGCFVCIAIRASVKVCSVLLC